jgi:hypothetical protein
MTFGTELKDNFKIIDDHLGNSISFTAEFREWLKERVQLEKEYATKLESMSKKMRTRLERRVVNYSVGIKNNINAPVSPTSATSIDTSFSASESVYNPELWYSP